MSSHYLWLVNKKSAQRGTWKSKELGVSACYLSLSKPIYVRKLRIQSAIAASNNSHRKGKEGGGSVKREKGGQEAQYRFLGAPSDLLVHRAALDTHRNKTKRQLAPGFYRALDLLYPG